MLRNIDEQYIDEMNQHLFLNMAADFYLGKEFDESLKWLDRIFQYGAVPAYIEAKAYFYKMEIAKATGEDFNKFYDKAVNILEKSSDKTREELYLLASLYKENKLEKAKETLDALVDTFPIDKLTGGAYFHLGEIAFNEKKKQEAKEYFKRCISVIENHGKAKDYLKNLEDKNE